MVKWIPKEILKHSITEPRWSLEIPLGAEEPGEPRVAPSVLALNQLIGGVGQIISMMEGGDRE